MSIKHLAIIMDGNRRWALSRNLKSYEGHVKGANNLFNTIESVNKNKISENYKVSNLDLINNKYVLLQRGKKNYYLLIVN